MTPGEATGLFTDSMTDAEMHQALRAVEDGGCQVYRHPPDTHPGSSDLWLIRLSNPTWAGPQVSENGFDLPLYEQHADGSWHMRA